MKQNQPQRSVPRDQQAREKNHCTAGMRGTCSSQRFSSPDEHRSGVGVVGAVVMSVKKLEVRNNY